MAVQAIVVVVDDGAVAVGGAVGGGGDDETLCGDELLKPEVKLRHEVLSGLDDYSS